MAIYRVDDMKKPLALLLPSMNNKWLLSVSPDPDFDG